MVEGDKVMFGVMAVKAMGMERRSQRDARDRIDRGW